MEGTVEKTLLLPPGPESRKIASRKAEIGSKYVFFAEEQGKNEWVIFILIFSPPLNSNSIP